jgi:hypothetical protein
MFDERGKLVTQLVRTQALLWSSENPVNKQRLRQLIQDIERRIAEFDRELSPPLPHGTAPKLGALRR